MSLVIDGLSKKYGKRWGLRDFSLECEGGVVGLVGPNGAGKTTLMRIIATLLPQTSGKVSWKGLDIRTQSNDLRQILGYLPQDFGLYPEFSARQFLRFMADMKGLPKDYAFRQVDEVLEIVNLEQEADRKLKTYSGGMKQRVGIAQAILNQPELLIVDEPTVGLDPAERVRFRTLIAGLTSNRLVILSTHIIGDVEAVANRLIVMNEGVILADTTPELLIRKAAERVWTVVTDPVSAQKLQKTYQVSSLLGHPKGVQLKIISAQRPHEEAVLTEPSLEDAYLFAVQA